MEKYSVLLVDDEADVLLTMKKKIDWNRLGYNLVGTAENGEEALEMAEQLHIDVVMTDIKMPYMDGLSLCKKLKELYRNIKVVIYSGFDDFEFAREAIRVEAEEYLLKPISSKDMEEVFTRLHEKLDREFSEHRNMSKLFEYYEKSLPAMQEQLVGNILEGKVTGERAKQMLLSYELNLDSKYYSVAILSVDESSDNLQIREKTLKTLSLRDMAKDYLSERFDYYVVNYIENVVILFKLNNEKEIDRLLYHVDQICKMASRVLKMSVTVAVGQVSDSIDMITSSYREAEHALEYRNIFGGGQVLYIKDIEPSPNEGVSLMGYDVQKLMKAVKIGNKEETWEAIQSFMKMVRETGITPYQYQLLCMELSTELMKIGRAYKLSTSQILGKRDIPLQDLHKYVSMEELESWLSTICTNLRQTLKDKRIDSTKKLTDNARQFIEENYVDSTLSVEKVCSELNLSGAYFSTIFKREVGESFVAYLTKVRLEKAEELLRCTNKKTYEIAEEIGYTEPNYFSYVFKKAYGVSPTKYRSSLEENHSGDK